MPKIFSKLIDI